MVSSTPLPHFTPGQDLVPILQGAGWAPGPVWTGGKSRPHRDSIPDRPARSQSLYRLSYRAHNNIRYFHIFMCICWFRYHMSRHSTFLYSRSIISVSFLRVHLITSEWVTAVHREPIPAFRSQHSAVLYC